MPNTPPRYAALVNWLFAPVALLAIGVGVAIVKRGPGWMLGATLTFMVGAVFLWIFVSVFWPSKASKTCPACGKEDIRRLDKGSTRGIVCSSCGHQDETASSFYLAEESDEPMEPMLLDDRAARRRERAGANVPGPGPLSHPESSR